MTGDVQRIGVKVEHVPDALDDREQPAWVREADTQADGALAG
jgi:hypothetical protein